MGCTASKLSCIPNESKKRTNNKKKNPVKDDSQERIVESVETAVKHDFLASTKVAENFSDKKVAHFLDAAPKSFTSFKAQTNTKKNPKEVSISTESIRPSLDALFFGNSPNAPHVEKPVDAFARQLALNKGRPSTWKDLYWHIIESRGLTGDEEKLGAIFTWLCSLDSFELPPSHEPSNKAPTKKSIRESPISMMEAFQQNQITHHQAFEIICEAFNIECVTISGIAKGADFNIHNNDLVEDIEETKRPLYDESLDPQIHPLAANHVHSWNACKVNGKWELFDPIWAARRLAIRPDEVSDTTDSSEAKSPQQKFKDALLLQYETDMFFFKTDPQKLILTHFPFDPKWQLMEPQVDLKKFYNTVLLKPIFFRYGLGIYSHMEACIVTKNELVIKLKLPRSTEETDLIFTFNLTLDGLGDIQKSQNLSPFGMHWISEKDKLVTFRFRFPRSGRYRLVLYARRRDEKLFADICEYSIRANVENSGSIYPFPHDNQTSYGPTERAKELNVIVTPKGTENLIATMNGMIELKFRNSINGILTLPSITARLRNVLTKTSELQDCLLFRKIEACQAKTGMSDYLHINPKNPMVGFGAGIPLSVVSAYLPKPGEYTLELFAKSHEASEEDSYSLFWQFMINAESAWPMNDSLRENLRCTNMGPQNELWERLGLATLSHVDPLIRIPTDARTKSKNDLLTASLSKKVSSVNRYSSQASTINSSFATESTTASQITIMDANQLEMLKNDKNLDSRKYSLEEINEEIQERPYDLKIVITGPKRDVLTVIAQFIDISEGEEKDVTSYLHRLSDKESNNSDDLLDEIMHKELSQSDFDLSSSTNNSMRIAYHLRIPSGGHFYKLYLYASPADMEITENIPLVFTYLIEAPIRLTSSEKPYIGSVQGPYEK